MRTGIALGANLGDRLASMRQARTEILELEGIDPPLHSSSVYETDPIDCGPGTPSFFNAVIEVRCFLHPTDLLDQLQTIEAAMGRPSKRPRNAPRPIDLDILYVGNLVLHNEEIVIPHPRLTQRRFVLQPLHDIAPGLLLPGHDAPITRLLEEVDDDSEVRLVREEW